MNRSTAAMFLAFAPLTAFGAIKNESIPDLRPPRPEIPASAEKDERRPWLFAGVGLAVIAIALCWPRRKPAPPPLPPSAVARRELDSLRAEPARATPAELSAIVRRYAVAAFDLPGSGVTAEEVASGLVLRRACPPELANAAWQFLAECDVKKFAPAAPDTVPSETLGRAEQIIADLEAARAAAARTL